jgi:hypothetical protein
MADLEQQVQTKEGVTLDENTNTEADLHRLR